MTQGARLSSPTSLFVARASSVVSIGDFCPEIPLFRRQSGFLAGDLAISPAAPLSGQAIRRAPLARVEKPPHAEDLDRRNALYSRWRFGYVSRGKSPPNRGMAQYNGIYSVTTD